MSEKIEFTPENKFRWLSSMKCLENEKMTNSDMIKQLAAVGTFPKN